VLSRPTTDQTIDGVLRDLESIVLPAVHAEPARVAIQMMQQVLRGASVRAAHEIAWMHEEIDDIAAATAPLSADPAVAEAREALAEADARSLHLHDVQHRYHLAGDLLGAAVEVAYASGDQGAIEALRAVLQRRSDHEMQIIGQLDLVGRG
jgi:hypothetical protein